MVMVIFCLPFNEAPSQHTPISCPIPPPLSVSFVLPKPSFVFADSPHCCLCLTIPPSLRILQTVCPAGTLKKHARQLQAGEIQALPPPGVDGAGPAVAPTGAGAAAIADELMSQLRRAHCALVSCCCCCWLMFGVWGRDGIGRATCCCYTLLYFLCFLATLQPVFNSWISPEV